MRFITALFAITPSLFHPILSTAQSAGDYRSVMPGGTWTTAANWETYNGSSWVAASTSPTAADGVITILTGHTMSIPGSLTIDQTVVESDAFLNWDGGVLTIEDGTGTDLIVNGTFSDNSISSVLFSGNATWALDVSASIVRTKTNSSNNWQFAYEGGNSNIPATSNWICRKTGSATPSISSIGAYYGNLILENTSGAAWSTSSGSNFGGSTGFPTIKGNFDIGGGSNTPIDFTTTNTNASPIVVQGDLMVRATHTLSNGTGGRGFEVEGDVNVEGTLDNDNGAAGFGLLRFANSNVQNILGPGTIEIREMVMNKAANDAYLQRNLSPNHLTLNTGKVVLGAYNLTIPPAGVVLGGSAASYVQTDGDGLLKRTVSGTLTNFPVGNSAYNPLSFNNAGTTDIFGVRVADQVLTNGDYGDALTSDVVNRTWTVEEAITGGSNLSLTAQWNSTEELSNFDRTACYVSRYAGPGWNADASATAAGSDPYTRTRTGVTTLSYFAIGSRGVLPVELTDFSLVVQQREVMLSWQTKTERNNHHFSIERSNDGRLFFEIGQQLGAGATDEPQDYQFADKHPLPGLNYYRLRQVDVNGQSTYTPIITATLSELPAHLYPSIATDQLQVLWNELPDDAIHWAIFDANGRRLQSGEWDSENAYYELNINDLTQGWYLLRLQLEKQQPINLRFQKMR